MLSACRNDLGVVAIWSVISARWPCSVLCERSEQFCVGPAEQPV